MACLTPARRGADLYLFRHVCVRPPPLWAHLSAVYRRWTPSLRTVGVAAGGAVAWA